MVLGDAAVGRASDNQVCRRALTTVAALVVIAAWVLGAPGHAAAATAGHGLAATYYNDTALRSPGLVRTDAQVSFAWRGGSPSTRIAPDTFAARWRGYVETPTRGTYTFYVAASDGARMWIGGRQVLNRWTRSAAAQETAVVLTLPVGRHRIQLDYFEYTGWATARLQWRGPGIGKQVVPPTRLYLPTTAVPPQCADQLDNDGDGHVDLAADPGCETATDRTESPDPPPPAGDAQAWSDPATWGGEVPADGAAVTIPAGKVIVLDQNASLANLTIDGTLQFARRDLMLEADWIIVHGRLVVGSESEPFAHRATIRLRDLTPAENVMNMGDKVLGVMGGTLELHGRSRLGWTRLGASAARGAVQITLAQAPDWQPGDRIAIASTDYASSQDEEATVTAVSGNVVTLDRALEYSHFGTVQTFDGRPVDERAEVALLSRNVTVEGEAVSSAAGFGAQVMVMGGGQARIDGAQLQRVGQQGILRRYPIHFHMLGDAGSGSYLRNSSIHDSSNRCVTVHGTNQLPVTGNVCYDHEGHGIFLEDGAEHDNVIEGNLGFGTRQPAAANRLLPSDASPATFWITNPDNIVRNNVAAGSDAHGFWIALPQHPTGLFAATYPSQAQAMWPRRTALTEFSGNTAHSNGRDGLNFDHGPRPDGTTETTHHHARENPADTGSATVTTVMRDFTSWKNRGHGIWLRGAHHRVVDSTLADNAIATTFASNESFLQDSLVVGETANRGTPAEWEVNAGGVGRDGRSLPRPWDRTFPIRGFEFYDGRVGPERTTFVNFQPYVAASGERREQSALGYKLDNDFSMHPRNVVTGARFVNANRVYMQPATVGRDGDISSVFLDADGSVTGTAGRSVMVANPFLYGSGCEARADWNAQVCTGDYATLIVETGDGNPAAVKPVTLTRPDGKVQTLSASTEASATSASSTVLTGSAYSVAYAGGTPQRTKFVLYRGRDRWVRVSVPRGEDFRVLRYGCDVGQSGSWCYGASTSLAALASATRSSYWYDNHADSDPATGTLHMKITSTGADWDELAVEPAP